MPINTVTITYICRGDDPCGTSSGGQHQEQLNPSSSEILDDPSCVSRVATPIISRRGDEKKRGEEGKGSRMIRRITCRGIIIIVMLDVFLDFQRDDDDDDRVNAERS